ncbi:FHA domain-containing protein [Gloeobacter kilaueensis JS1]|uniref:FHA domain-containing protein n=2 Tax=Gloeobacter TaxID=33071 RepID=U5QSG8_GLOK1|nr:FHA domain-containing protein [Gloeobacter kilaueensis JS1]
MSAPACPNLHCRLFRQLLPEGAKVCPMCGTQLGNAVRRPPGQTNLPVAQPRPLLKLVHPASGYEFFVRGERCFIGRTPQPPEPGTSQIALDNLPDNQIVSRRHLQITWDAERSAYSVSDLGSRNGTALNGSPLLPQASYRLSNGDRLQLGKPCLIELVASISAFGRTPSPSSPGAELP